MDLRKPYLLFLGDARDQLAAKTAQGVAHWRPEWCVGQLRLEGCKADVGLGDVTIPEAAARGALTMLIGVANAGGVLPASWTDSIVEAIAHGMDVASGLHTRLDSNPEIVAAAERHGRQLHDVRHSDQTFDTGKGRRRSGRRLLTVGTDCSVGKMYTALALEREMRQRSMKADFRATGQTGIFIAGSGVSVDAVISDFISGATEWLTPDNEPDHWDLVEGQGSLFHASFAGVSLGLLHGAAADALVLCHEPTRTHMRGLPHAPLPSLEECIEANERHGRLTNPDCRVVGIAVNSSALPRGEAERLLGSIADRFGLPCVDPRVQGVAAIVDRLT